MGTAKWDLFLGGWGEYHCSKEDEEDQISHFQVFPKCRTNSTDWGWELTNCQNF